MSGRAGFYVDGVFLAIFTAFKNNRLAGYFLGICDEDGLLTGKFRPT
jgi:hypothetical protein